MRDKNGETEAAKTAWKLFEKTGSLSYYMLYHELTRKR
ncbi:MAG: YqzL family protein [Clostridiales bacterium]|nr:YqzL family protein [Clostridiales bacterium]